MAKNVEWFSNVFAFVGGANRRRIGQTSLLSTNFQGCLSKVQYTADGHMIDFLTMAAQGSSRSIVEVYGSVAFSCRDQTSAPQPLSFNDGFQFRTNEPDGLLLYHGSHDVALNRTGDYFAFELIDGQLYFVLDLGSGPLRLQASSTRVNEGSIWHSATMIRVGRTGSVTIDSTKTDFSTPGVASQLDL
uniref:Laminin G domain-containing protein n=1 Tax=Plectus sambesii TaxID=2011161 RepID=A0A914V1S7_9BILA